MSNGDPRMGFFLLVFGSFCIGMLVAFLADGPDMRREAIKHGAAHYDEYTGAFTWNNPAVEKP